MTLPADLPDTRVADLGPGAIARAPAAFRDLAPGFAALPVADPATWNAAGRELYGAFRAAGVPVLRPLVFDAPPRVSAAALARVGAALAAAAPGPGLRAAPFAVGGGTIAELCKAAAHAAGAPCAVLATAASSPTFAAPGARLPDAATGVPADLPCRAPVAVFAEPDVLARAPKRLAAAGYGELMALTVSGTDWLLAAGLAAEPPVARAAWDLFRAPLDARLNHPHELALGEPEPLDALLRGLVDAGLAMQRAGSGRPAYGSPRLFARVWEAAGAAPPGGPAPAAGALAGVGALCALAVYDALFAREFDPSDVDPALAAYPSLAQREAMVASLFPDGPLREAVLAECRAKHASPDALRERLDRVADAWPELRDRVDRTLMRWPRMQAMLFAAGAPSHPAQLGVPPARAAAAAIAAQMLDRRYTVLDLAYETGRFAECVEAVRDAFAPPTAPAAS